jgi:carbon monoxide dehydrogenase subunit G
MVWAALNDPAILKQWIPGCEVLDMSSPTEMTATVVFRVGPVKATFGGKVTLSDLDPPNSYHISGEGSGGVAGFAKGGATVRPEAQGPPPCCITTSPPRSAASSRNSVRA